MDRPENKERLDRIYAQLLKIANGNFSYQIERSDKNDVLEALTFLVNSATEEIKDAFMHQGFVNIHDSYRHIVQMFFELDDSGRIQRTNDTVVEMLDHPIGALAGLPFTELLSPDSQKGWSKVMKVSQSHSIWEMTVSLDFATPSGLTLPTHCHIICFPKANGEKRRIIVTCFDMVQNKGVHEKRLKKNVERKLRSHKLLPKTTKKETAILHIMDVENLRTAEQYIMDNLDRPLPSIKVLALICGTNEFKFKKGFKELYGMTVFQFQKNERLRKAHILIEHSNRTISAIAKMVGFKKGNHLAREFRKRYGYSPTELRMLSK